MVGRGSALAAGAMASVIMAAAAFMIAAMAPHPQTEVRPTESPDPLGYHEGVYRVGNTESGNDITPGLYRTKGVPIGATVDNCFWARLSELDGQQASVLAEKNFAGATTIEIKASDKGVEFSGECVWRKIG